MAFFIALFSLSCSSDDDNQVTSETDQLLKIQELSNATHVVELWNTSGKLHTGFNDISIRIKDKASNTFIDNAKLSWMPIMAMPTMEHAGPKSELKKVPEATAIYQGYIVFQMTNLDGSGWDLTINYEVDGVAYNVQSAIQVLQAEHKNVTTFSGSDDNKYILTIIEPKNPKIATNKIKMGLFKMENMMSFAQVKNFKIALDPRMPDMGNHSSPNNQDLTFNENDGFYEGKVALTMSGFWVLNLKLFDDQGTLLKGDDVSTENPKSSLNLELEF